MSAAVRLTEDWHVHSTFSDGVGTLAENIAAATAVGLTTLGCVDHVRRETIWVPDFVAAVRVAQETTSLTLRVGIEAKLLDGDGTLDVPDLIEGVDDILIADHQFPLGRRVYHPRDIRSAIGWDALTPAEAIESLVTATCRAMERHPRAHLAHLFSVLPKAGLDEQEVPQAALERLARTAAATGARVEISERWRCPGLAALRAFAAAGVPIVASTDGHRPDAIGQYSWVREMVAALAGPAAPANAESPTDGSAASPGAAAS